MKLEEKLVNLLIEKKLVITTAESCTGGMLGAYLVNVPGVSGVYHQGFITYANEAKHRELGVKNKTLKKYGAVSRQTAKQMAKGAAKHAGADVAVAVTGIAGPDGGTPEKPVGTVFIGCFYHGVVKVKEFHFEGSRSEIRELTVKNALAFTYRMIST
ncbi:MAG: CinA family protein [Lachnospiraceae bacterium]|nr:CinA family protein [Lachnospiraceae bacterium]